MTRPLAHSTLSSETEIPVVEMPASVIPARCFRSTWVVSSLDGLRERGHFEQYQEHLGLHREEILHAIAGIWLPMAVAREHYEACERLRIPDGEYAEIAKAGGKVRQAWNAGVIAELQALTATPWTAMTQLRRTWKRSADGGGFAAYKLSNNQARAIYVGCELFDVAYFRRAVRFMVHTMCAYKGKNVRVQEIPEREPGSAPFLITWE